MSRSLTLAKALLPVAALALAACDDGGPNTNARIRVAAPAQVGASTAANGALEIAGTNGTLRITEIKLIVDEFELEGDDDDCNILGGRCGEFEKELFTVDVPLGTGSVTIASDVIPEGVYNELEFEVEDLLDDDLDDDDDLRRLQQVLAQLRTQHADWPDSASMLIVGTFTPTGGVAQEFRVYFDAEIEVEYDLVPPLVVSADSPSEITINLRPDLWFRNGDGTVRNLAAFHYPTYRALVEFEAEFEGGLRIEFDD
jgi:hypothetical protein